ncbi:hypothetical protein X760_24545 [Mesorhizobium sp. LSHC422A00]|uniref:DegT/DnrJ/EryC1/StrS family aminotransferase n=1 Tax=unclassified Mesorhizobium TaxID=325217 RepID=UPI0003CE2B94|nr:MULTISPECIES: aminotransferase class I/II-fold pyridoxal phosphate-dependent enzyme [unclassified Mesorhizobium]ESW65301.1 hypothetical protein X771_23055 [Mesorhizobium sp. LSJC277A00]ESX56396.1 hypothetical protein X760_24545 [Mesorhizobium sp. LSHC422A00]
MNKAAFPFIVPDLPRTSSWVPIYESAFETGVYSNFGPLSRELERKLAERYAVRGYGAVACSSATQGLLAALMERFEPGQAIAFSNFTFAATYQAIRMAGLVPVPIDIDGRTLEMSVDSLSQAINRTQIDGVMPVRPFGLVRDQSELVTFCQSKHLPLIFDAAASLGGAQLPLFGSDAGEVEVFSLHATKTFAIGEGGVIFAPLDRVEAIRKRLNFGFEADRTYFRGTNGKMDELHAALALAQLGRIDEMQAAREKHARRYDMFFSSVEDAQIPTNVTPGSGWTMYPVIFSKHSAPELIAKALEHGIEAKRYYWPTVSSGANDRIDQFVKLDVSERIARNIVCFPIYSLNTEHLVDGLFGELDRLFF